MLAEEGQSASFLMSCASNAGIDVLPLLEAVQGAGLSMGPQEFRALLDGGCLSLEQVRIAAPQSHEYLSTLSAAARRKDSCTKQAKMHELSTELRAAAALAFSWPSMVQVVMTAPLLSTGGAQFVFQQAFTEVYSFCEHIEQDETTLQSDAPCQKLYNNLRGEPSGVLTCLQDAVYIT